jgi:hypothetical protein
MSQLQVGRKHHREALRRLAEGLPAGRYDAAQDMRFQLFYGHGKFLEVNRISAQAAQYGKNPEPYQLQIGFRANGFHGGMKAKPENV